MLEYSVNVSLRFRVVSSCSLYVHFGDSSEFFLLLKMYCGSQLLTSVLSSIEMVTRCRTGHVRVVGGANSSEGRVEVCLNGQWGKVSACCDVYVASCHYLSVDM